jgi:hypothetical protein
MTGGGELLPAPHVREGLQAGLIGILNFIRTKHGLFRIAGAVHTGMKNEGRLNF